MPSSNKAKIAKRVIEVLEYFDENCREATVMSIARRYDWPQSSTSELLSSLVDLGLLHKNYRTRSYTPTPRAALLGASVQLKPVRNGRLFKLIDWLSDETGYDVCVQGMVNLDAQIFTSKTMNGQPSAAGRSLQSGRKEQLTSTAAGWMLLTKVAQKRRDAMIRRLNAEALEDSKFNVSELTRRIEQCGSEGFAFGPAGYGTGQQMCAILLPDQPLEQPMTIGLVSDTMGERPIEQLAAQMRDLSAELFRDMGGPHARAAQPLHAGSIGEPNGKVGMPMGLDRGWEQEPVVAAQ